MPSTDTVAISKVRPWHPPIPRDDIVDPATVLDLVGLGPELLGTFQVIEQGFVFTYHEAPYRHNVDPATGETTRRVQLSRARIVTWDEIKQ